jgi:hypothetical protein
MYKSVLLILVIQGILFSQDIFEPSYSSVYNFLNRLSVKGAIVFNDELRPLSRRYIAEKLLEAESKSEKLTVTESEELVYYKKDFYPEILVIQGSDKRTTLIFKNDEEAGFRPFFYRDKNFPLILF